MEHLDWFSAGCGSEFLNLASEVLGLTPQPGDLLLDAANPVAFEPGAPPRIAANSPTSAWIPARTFSSCPRAHRRALPSHLALLHASRLRNRMNCPDAERAGIER